MASAFDRALRRPDCFYLFIYFVAGSLPSWPNRGALCTRGRSRGDSGGTWPRLGGFGQAGGCVCGSPPSPALPSSPLASVTIRRNVVAGSMTPWAEAASARSSLPVAAGGGRAARAGTRATCRGLGQSAALSPRPAQVPGHRRGEGLRGPRGPRPGCAPQAGPRPKPASASRSPRSAPERQLALCVCPERGSSLLVRQPLCGFLGTW